MQTLSYGVKKPETGDTGAVFFTALEDNAQKQNDHTHNGSNSSKLSTSATTSTTGTILAAAWGSIGGGMFSQIVTMPVGLLYDECMVTLKDSTGDIVHLSRTKTSANTYTVVCNDATLTLTAVYTS